MKDQHTDKEEFIIEWDGEKIKYSTDYKIVKTSKLYYDGKAYSGIISNYFEEISGVVFLQIKSIPYGFFHQENEFFRFFKDGEFNIPLDKKMFLVDSRFECMESEINSSGYFIKSRFTQKTN